MSIINLYFYIWSKGNFVSCRGWILCGVFGFFLPLLFTLSLINLFLKKISYPDIGQHDSFLVYTIYIADFYILLLSA